MLPTASTSTPSTSRSSTPGGPSTRIPSRISATRGGSAIGTTTCATVSRRPMASSARSSSRTPSRRSSRASSSSLRPPGPKSTSIVSPASGPTTVGSWTSVASFPSAAPVSARSSSMTSTTPLPTSAGSRSTVSAAASSCPISRRMSRGSDPSTIPPMTDCGRSSRTSRCPSTSTGARVCRITATIRLPCSSTSTRQSSTHSGPSCSSFSGASSSGSRG